MVKIKCSFICCENDAVAKITDYGKSRNKIYSHVCKDHIKEAMKEDIRPGFVRKLSYTPLYER